MKKCPFCAEEIQDDAIKCRHCQSYLSQDNANQLSQTEQPPISSSDDKKRVSRRNKGIVMLFFGCLLLLVNIQRGGGFVGGGSAEATGANIAAFASYILIIFLIVKGIKGFIKEKVASVSDNKKTIETIISFILLIVILVGALFFLSR